MLLSNGLLALHVHVLPLKPLINGVFPALLFRIESASSSLFFASSKFAHLRATSASSANVSNFIGPRTQINVVAIASTVGSAMYQSSIRRSLIPLPNETIQKPARRLYPNFA
jgi:hypothetical protein